MKRKLPTGLFRQEMRDIVFGVLGIVFFTVFIVNSLHLRFGIATTTVIGADFFPKLFCGIGLFLSVLLVIVNAVAWKRNTREPESSSGEERETDAAEHDEKKELLRGYGRVVLCILFMIAFIIMIKYLGFLISAVVYEFVQLLYLSTPKQRKDARFVIRVALLSILVPAVLYVVFRYGLNIMLPMGILK